VGQIIEWILIFLALLSLWPWILGYRAPWYRGLLIVALAAMVWVAVRRITRVRRAR
jgi:predicted membrane metal-binding protein